MGIRVREELCIGCSLCQLACPYDAIAVHVVARVDNARCTDCMACIDYCPTDALSGLVSFDAVVIGSGMGGLCAAARLTQRGYRTLVLEKAPSLGGRFSAFQHDGVKMNNGAFWLETGGILEETFRQVGAEFDVVIPHPQYRYWVRGRTVEVGEGAGMLRRALLGVSANTELAAQILEALKEGIQGRLPPPEVSLRQWVGAIAGDREGPQARVGRVLEDIQGVFQAITVTMLGPNAHELPAADFLLFLSKAAARGREFGYARKGGLHMMRELARAVARPGRLAGPGGPGTEGGQVWTQAEARRILVEEGRAAGVLVQRKGQPWEVRAPIVISNAGPRQTAALAGPENMRQDYLAELEAKARPLPQLIFSIESDRPLLDFGGTLYTVGTQRVCAIWGPTTVANEWAPPGVHLTEVTAALTDCNPPYDWEHELGLALQDLDEILPGWRQHGRLGATICMQDEYPFARSWAGCEVPVETPIPNLFNVGDGVRALGWSGLPSCAETAQRAVALIEERFPLARLRAP